jgi:hypothetical protein
MARSKGCLRFIKLVIGDYYNYNVLLVGGHSQRSRKESCRMFRATLLGKFTGLPGTMYDVLTYGIRTI